MTRKQNTHREAKALNPRPTDAVPAPVWARHGPALWLAFGVIVLLAAALYFAVTPRSVELPAPSKPGTPQIDATSASRLPAPAYVGGAACASCHAKEHEAWKGSHHDSAMAEASDATVLGNFADVKFNHAGVTSTFFRRGGKFFVITDGPDGKPGDYEIKYTFGFTLSASSSAAQRAASGSVSGASDRI